VCIGSRGKNRNTRLAERTAASIGIERGIYKHQHFPGIQLEEVAELVVAHIISTFYPRRSKALKEIKDAAITTRAKEPAWS
jgi:hypothetical protein